jgi:nicotinamidase-related amidase
MPPPALVLIDIQTGFDAPGWGARNNPGAENAAAGLLAAWRAAEHPVIHVRHVSRAADSPLSQAAGGTAFKPQVAPAPGEPVFDKAVNSALIGTGLQAHLAAEGLSALVVCGLTTPHCVSTTVRMAANLGFDVTLAHDACAAFAANADTGWAPGRPAMDPDTIHAAAVSHLHGEFCRAAGCDEIQNGPA